MKDTVSFNICPKQSLHQQSEEKVAQPNIKANGFNSDNVSDEFSHIVKSYRKGGSLKNRRDVVNKSLIRAIKKLFSLKFKDEHHQPRFRTSYKCLKHFETTLTEFTQFLLESASQSERGVIWPVSKIQQITDTLGAIVNYKLLLKLKKYNKQELSKGVRTFISLLNKCCKNYTHKIFEKVVEHGIFPDILQLFMVALTPEYRHQIPVFCSNTGTYDEAIDELYKRVMRNN